jgi:hypothetical protein
MKHASWAVFAAVACALPACETDAPTSSGIIPSASVGFDPYEYGPTNSGEIGWFFAPFILQDTDASWADALTNFTYDDDWAGGNNWDNLTLYPLRSYVYASITETADFYFVYYSLFHPRDWSAEPYLFGFDDHENDLEMIFLVVDKQFVSSTWPYGTPIVVETIDHALGGSRIRSYRNCSFTGYAISEWHERFEGCIKFVQEERTTQTPTGGVPPAYRVTVYSEAHGHGISMHTGPNLFWDFGGGDGYVYLPGNTAQVVQSNNGWYEYRLISLLTDELSHTPGSLWKRRLSSGVSCSATYETLLETLIGPHDVAYGMRFRACDGNSPEGTLAKAPWGQRPNTDESDIYWGIGDFHNHGAWTLVRHFSSPRFPYSSTTASRSSLWMYWYNPFAAPEEASSSAGDGSGGYCGSADPYNCGCDPAITPCPAFAAAADAGTLTQRVGLRERQPIPREARRVSRGDSSTVARIVRGARFITWSSGSDWQSWVQANPVSGALTTSRNDGGWGYRDSIAEVLTVPPGEAVTSPVIVARAHENPNLTIRFWADPSAFDFVISWFGVGVTGEQWYSVFVPAEAADGGWRTIDVFLLGHPGWSPDATITQVRLWFPEQTDIDFLTLHN